MPATAALQETRALYPQTKTYSKANSLIEAMGKTALINYKLFAIAISCAIYDEEKNRIEAVIPSTKLRELFGTSGGGLYTSVKAACTKSKNRTTLLDYSIMIENDEKQSFQTYNVITAAKFENGILTVTINDELRDEIINLKSNYTILQLGEVMRLQSVHSFRLYEILKSKLNYFQAVYGTQDAVEWEVGLTELKLKMDIIDPMSSDRLKKAVESKTPDYEKIEQICVEERISTGFARYNNLRMRVLDPAINELNEKTSLSAEYRPIKAGKGGKIIGIIFTIGKKNREKKKESPGQLSDARKFDIMTEIASITGETFSSEDLVTILQKADWNIEKVKKAYAVMEASTRDIDNPVAYMVTAIEKGFEPAKKKKKKNPFNDYPQTNYDFDKLEKLIVNH